MQNSADATQKDERLQGMSNFQLPSNGINESRENQSILAMILLLRGLEFHCILSFKTVAFFHHILFDVGSGHLFSSWLIAFTASSISCRSSAVGGTHQRSPGGKVICILRKQLAENRDVERVDFHKALQSTEILQDQMLQFRGYWNDWATEVKNGTSTKVKYSIEWASAWRKS